MEKDCSPYIVDWTKIERNSRYVVFAIAQGLKGEMYPYKPEVLWGWQVQQLTPHYYVALPLPECDFSFMNSV